MIKTFSLAVTAVFALALTTAEARAADWTLTSTLVGCNMAIVCGGPYPLYGPPNGHVEQVEGGFTLTGDDLPHYVALTTYTTVAEASGDYTFSWDYYNYEPLGFGSNQDPAGYVIDGALTQLTVDSPPFLCGVGDPACTVRAQSGRATVSVSAGQTYGFYVGDADGGYGAGVITVRAVPEPLTWMLLILGFGGVGAAIRQERRRHLGRPGEFA